MKIDKNLLVLTDAEKLWLWRYRQGETQPQAAKRLGVSLRTYQGQERGTARLWGGEKLAHKPITPAESCALARRRAAWGLRRTARKAKMSHVTFLREEQAGAPAVVAFWRTQGFQFQAQTI